MIRKVSIIFVSKEITKISNSIIKEILTPILKEVKKFEKESSIHITTHSGKLQGFNSINTSSLSNPYCVERSKNQKTICSKCYSNTLQKLRKQLNDKLEQNSKVLSERILPISELPLINALYFRFQAFGDLINMNHLLNLLNIAWKNPKVQFGLWTKRIELIKEINNDFNRDNIPNNIVFIYSNPMIDKPMKEVPKGFDKVFQVFSKEFDIKINCGAKSCLKCHICYDFDTTTIINEKVK